MTICAECKMSKMPGLAQKITDRMAWQCYDGPPDIITGERRLVPCINKNDGACPDFDQAGISKVFLIPAKR